MEAVERCRETDIPQVAQLHAEVYYPKQQGASEALCDYYREMFFGNPWVEEDLPSLVYRRGEDVVGFLGVIPRPMLFEGERIRMAVTHRMMVSPQFRNPFAAVRLMERFFAGSQDLSFSDGANDMGRKFWEGRGGSTAWLYSMNWVKFFGICQGGLAFRFQNHPHRAVKVLQSVLAPVDACIRLVGGRFFQFSAGEAAEDAVSAETLLEAVENFSQEYSLRPIYDRRSFTWLFDFMQSNRERGKLRGMLVKNQRGKPLGAYVYYLHPSGLGEVVLLMGREGETDVVLGRLFGDAQRNGVVALWGRLEPRFLPSLWKYHCLIKRGSWALAGGRNHHLLNAIYGADAFLTTLEGELWLRSPRDGL